MAKVIVERPRTGGGVRFPRGAGPDGRRVCVEEWKTREGIRRPWLRTSGQKFLNENLAPLRRYLRSNVGRPWNKIYSEICQRINRESAVQLHVWQHLMMDVCLDPHVISGEVARRSFFGHYRFYVDPRSGLLREGAPHRLKRDRPKPHLPNDRVDVDETHQIRRIEGIWYELELARIPRDSSVFDLGTKLRCIAAAPREVIDFYGRPVFATKKRQLSKKEIRRLRGNGTIRDVS